MELPRKEYWIQMPFPSPGDLPDPGIKPRSPALWADALPSEPPGKPRNALPTLVIVQFFHCSSPGGFELCLIMALTAFPQ